MTQAPAALAVVAPRHGGFDWISAADPLIAVVTNRLNSEVSRRDYRTALPQVTAWHVAQDGRPLSRAVVQRYRARSREEGRRRRQSTST